MPSAEDLTNLADYFQSLSAKELSQIFIAEIGKKEPNLSFIKYLISLGAHIDNSKNAYSPFTTPMHLAAQKGHLQVIKILIESGANQSEDMLFKGTPLHTASEYGQMEVVKFFLAAGLDVNVKIGGGATPLHLAAKAGHIKVVEFLLDSGADINSKSSYSTPIYWAVIGNQVAVVDLLIKRGANLKVIYHGFDGYGGENMNLIQAATTRSFDISMTHEVTAESQEIVSLLKRATL